MLAYDYPLLGIFWTMFILFLWIAWIFVVIRIFADIFRSDDVSGWAKALWTMFIIVVPFVGVLVYLVARGKSMTNRDIAQAQAAESARQDYIRHVARNGASPADELIKLAALLDQGMITADEYAQQKAAILAP